MKSKDGKAEFLKNDKTQRLIYGGITLLWIFGGLNMVKYKYDFSPFYFDILYAIIIPTIILILPILINRRIFWIGALGFSIMHTIWTIYKIVFAGLSNFHRDYAPNSMWKIKDILVSVFMIFISCFICWIIWKIKPERENTMHNNVYKT
ncbi:hypothetical protein [Psychroserpens sp. Hel_I_66]|uniref:hypothetical protein n=1 Tax=Psychroserpens sp. Hel_I_66 TaxID=1250004 RepID=UPI0006459545|nr:hypothetical protein [Psychroserpens sp. Hel_I_66]